jgi:predicted MFS family arabinose efflux permease
MKPPETRRSTLILLAAAGFVSGASMRASDPLLPTLAAEFGVRVRDAASVLTAFVFAYGMFQIIHGAIGDRFGKLRVVSIAMLFAAVAAGACAFADGLSDLSIYRFLTGMTAGAVIPLSLAFIGDRFAYEGRQAKLGRFIAGTLLGQSMGPLIGGTLSDLFGWRTAFGALGAAFLVVGVLLGREAARDGDHGGARFTPPWQRYGEMLRSARARAVLATVGIEGMLFFGAFGFAGAYLKQRFGLSDSLTGLIIAGFGIGGVAYSVLVPRLVKRLGETGLVGGGGIVLVACFAGLATMPTWIATVPFVVLLGFGFYMLHNTLQVRATEMSPNARGAGVSFFALSLFLGQAVGVTAFGAIMDRFGYPGPFVATGVLLAMLAWLFRRFLKTHPIGKSPA